MFNQCKTQSMFCTNAQFVSTVKKDEPPPIPDFIPIPKTKKEAKEANKYVFLPGERLAQTMARQNIKDKKKKKKSIKLTEDDIDGISGSVSRISQLFD
jgi:hypothetical protein